MATILLQAAGGLAGGLVGGPVGAALGRAAGGLAGAAIDGALFSDTRRVEGPRLADGRVNGADEGAGIARLYGTARVAGQIIWATRFEETRRTERQGGKGGPPSTETTTYAYAANVAVGLCEGPVAAIRRVWADGEELDLTGVTIRLHRGTETQEPDPLIEARQGAGRAPAYRGLAYLVFERLPLERWGNRVPQIACEVIRPVGALETAIRAVTIIPGASEHGLDPRPVRERVDEGEDRVLNRNMTFGASDVEASLDELVALCPNVERAALVVSWFGDDLRAGACRVQPGVELRSRDETEDWRAGDVGRGGARLLSRIDDGPSFGGTPSDAGVLRAMAAMKARGLRVTYYPFILMDVPPGNALPDPYGGTGQPVFPWRGRITLDVAPGRSGSADRTAGARQAIDAFLGNAEPADFRVEDGEVRYSGPAEWSYRRMILHQAHLAKLGGADAFVIGSEMRGLTTLRDEADRFPFVEGLMRLAAECRAILPEATITYAADWSEYFGHQPADGSDDVFFHLDPLWAHPAIDAVGIDNYLPAADWRDEDWDGGGPDGARSPYDADALAAGIAGGERFDWFYASEADRAARIRTPITDGAAGKPWVFRAKDLRSWWANPHFDRRGGVEVSAPSPWVPEGKPVWFTELGCPAIDKGANQPNVFVDPKSSESHAPYFSTGARDDLAQRRFLETQLRHWDSGDEILNPVSSVYGGPMVDPGAIHLWTWDARPFPAFPDRSETWSDGGNWRLGHWLTGRLGTAPLDALILALLADHGVSEVDAEHADAILIGYLASGPGTARSELEELLRLCGIAANAAGARLVVRSLAGGGLPRPIDVLAEEADEPILTVRRAQASEMPEEVVIAFADPERAYQPGTASARLSTGAFPRKEALDLPAALPEDLAGALAGRLLRDGLAAREVARFALPPTELGIEPGDRLAFTGAISSPGRWMVSRLEAGEVLRVEARRMAEPGPLASRPSASGPAGAGARPVLASRPAVHLLDLPSSGGMGSGGACVAVFARPWLPHLVALAQGGEALRPIARVPAPATLGTLLESLGAGPEGLPDTGHSVLVRLRRGGLESVSRARLLAGANVCAIASRDGGWEVLQFERAEEIEPGVFRLTTLLRAQGGTDDAMRAGADAGAAFVLLDDAVQALALPPSVNGTLATFRVAPAGRPFDDAAAQTRSAILGRRALRPLSPAHLRCLFESDGGIALSWVRRGRVDADDWSGLDVPLGEEVERYRVTLSDGAGGTAAIDADAPRLAVSAGDQTAAFGGLPARISVSVAQYSLAHGPGTERSAAFDRPAASSS